MLRFYQLLLGVLLVWRVTHLLGAEFGPSHLLERLRSSVSDFWQELIGCFYCLSLWIAAPVACVLGGCWQDRLMLWPALSAGAILIERVTTARPMPLAPYYIEDQEVQNVWMHEATPDAQDGSVEPGDERDQTGYRRQSDLAATY